MFNRNRTMLWAVLAMPIIALSLIAQEPAPKPEQTSDDKNDSKIVDKIHGDYVLRGGIIDGNKMTADRIADVSVKITDKTITTYDGQREQRFSAAYRVLSDKRPWQVTLKSVKKVPTSDGKAKEKVEQSDGIIDVSEDGTRLWLAYSVNGAERPKDFKGAKQQNVFELERLKKPKPE